MSNHFFLQGKQKPNSVNQLITDLQVKLCQQKLRFSPNYRIIKLNQITRFERDISLMPQYQQLIGAVKQFFFQQGEQVTFATYQDFMQALNELLQDLNCQGR